MYPTKEVLENDPNYKEFVKTKIIPDFIIRAFPNTKNTPIPGIVNQLLLGLEPFCEPNEHEVKFIVRGGAMRMFELNTQSIESQLSESIRALPKDIVGDDELTNAVISNTFPSTKDLDVRFNPLTFFHEFEDGIFASQLGSTQITNNLIRTLNKIGFEEDSDGEEIRLENDQYTILIKKAFYGITSQQLSLHLDFYRKESTEAIFRLDLGTTPTTEQEEKENLRMGDDQSDMDKRTEGFIFHEREGLMVRYFNYYGISEASMYLQEYFFNFETNPLEMRSDFVKAFSKGFREINFRVSDQVPLWLQYNKLTLKWFIDIFKSVGDSLLSPEEVAEWASYQKEAISKRRVTLLSDIIYGMVANPFLALPLAYYSEFLKATPLGSLIDNPDKLETVLNLMAAKTKVSPNSPLYELSLAYIINCVSKYHPENIGPLILIDALKAADLLSADEPRTLSYATNQLFNPLALMV